MIPLIFLFFLLVIGLIIYGAYAAAKRRKELAAWAFSHGLSFSTSKSRYLETRFPEFKCLHQGHNRYSYNMMEGTWNERTFIGFDYHYETHSTNSKGHRRTDHHHFSSVILEAKIPLKGLFIRPESFFDKITEFLGFDDIDFESAEFSRKFFVKAKDRRWAYDVIHQRTMEFLLSMPHFTIQFDRTHVIAFRSSKFKSSDYDSAVQVIEGILDGLPDYVKKQQIEATR